MLESRVSVSFAICWMVRRAVQWICRTFGAGVDYMGVGVSARDLIPWGGALLAIKCEEVELGGWYSVC